MSSKSAAAQDTKDDNEPSMEEILASIRKIIADDSLGTKKDEPQAKATVKKAPDPVPEPVAVDVVVEHEEEDEDVLDLAQVATVTGQPVEVSVEVPPHQEDDLPEMMFEPVEVMIHAPVAPPVIPPAPINHVAALEDRILSDNTGSLVSQAFQSLSRHTPMPAVGRSLEDVVVELVRPMLRGWLDDHLPGIVEKLVKAEIERVARG
jgi:cell pole-organizing protein PopZ